MKKSQAISQIDFHNILDEMLPAPYVKQVIPEVESFLKSRHNLPRGVLNIILIRTIMITKDKLFNAAYLRMVTETFKAEGIKTVHSAIEYLERSHDHARSIQKKEHHTAHEPEWLEGVIQEFAKMEG